MHLQHSSITFISALLYTPFTYALNLDVSNTDSIKTAAKSVAQDLLGYYNGSQPGQILGLFGQNDTDVYWWESGAVWGSLINYWKYTGDTQFNNLVAQGLLAQTGPNNDFMPPNQTKTEGNDDQGFWALAAMTAAELQLPNPSTGANTTWLDLARSVFDLQVKRWDTKTCGGGLRWQIFTFNRGYDYKNTVSNGVFFQLAARLARYTGDQSYADWAEKSYDWLASSALVTSDLKIYDGASTSGDCKDASKLQWTYNTADLLYGSAVMYNLTTGNPDWKNRTQGLLSGLSVFVTNQNVLREIACETQNTCNYDQFSFKGIAAQWMGATIQLAPFTAGTITPYLQASAKGAAASCSGGDNKTSCGFDWTVAKYDGKPGVGQELSALNVILANLAAQAPSPSTFTTESSNSKSGDSAPTNSTNTASPSATPSDGAFVGHSPKLMPLSGAMLTLLLVVAMSFLMM